jgi:hypothetical protein
VKETAAIFIVFIANNAAPPYFNNTNAIVTNANLIAQTPSQSWFRRFTTSDEPKVLMPLKQTSIRFEVDQTRVSIFRITSILGGHRTESVAVRSTNPSKSFLLTQP